MDFELYVIVDRGLRGERDPIEIASEVIRGGAKVIQLRDKSATTRELIKAGESLRDLAHSNNVTFIINDRVDVVVACDADGVHLGQDDLPVRCARRLMGERIIGVSTHTIDQALRAEEEGADYISIGPIFSTELKPDYPPVGLELIHQVKGEVKIPFVAIGAINMGNVGQVIKAGADNIACCQAVMKAQDIKKATKELLERIKEAKVKR